MCQNTSPPHPAGGPPRTPAAPTGKRKPKENFTWWPSWPSSCPGTPKNPPGTARDRPGTAQGPLGSAQGAPGTAQGAPGIAQGAPRDRPRSAQAQPRGHLKRLRPPWKLSRSSPRAAHRLPRTWQDGVSKSSFHLRPLFNVRKSDRAYSRIRFRPMFNDSSRGGCREAELDKV